MTARQKFAAKLFAAIALMVIGATAQRAAADPAPPDKGVIRIAAFNAALYRKYAGLLAQEMRLGGSEQIDAVAEIIQRVRPHIILINEFDYDVRGVAAGLFRDTLKTGRGGADGVDYPHMLSLPVNTGVQTGFDLDQDGYLGDAGDAHGFGYFPGQYGMILLSQLPIDHGATRSFQTLKWADMPASLIPPGHFGQAEATLRLSSKSHWDVTVMRPSAQPLSLLASHPTPPVFDGPEDANGRRNHDEIRFWVDYIEGEDWMTDDQGQSGGLAAHREFVVLGDLNLDPHDGAGRPAALNALMKLAPDALPFGAGGAMLAGEGRNRFHRGAPGLDTADFKDDPGPGNLRVDYVLPGASLTVTASGVFWPAPDDPLFRLIGDETIVSSDHRLVWVDVKSQ